MLRLLGGVCLQGSLCQFVHRRHFGSRAGRLSAENPSSYFINSPQRAALQDGAIGARLWSMAVMPPQGLRGLSGHFGDAIVGSPSRCDQLHSSCHACGRSWMAERALWFLVVMRLQGLQPNAITHTSMRLQGFSSRWSPSGSPRGPCNSL